jgi:catechol 2,3-dioxygenase-like lactoylglutathione lyase family enzyme
MKYLHTMVRVTDMEASASFYCEALYAGVPGGSGR